MPRAFLHIGVLSCAAALIAAASAAAVQPPSEAVDEAIQRLSAIRELDGLSRELWPGWKISDTAFAIYEDGGGFCYLVNHPDPPAAFSKERTSGRSRRSYHAVEAASVDPGAGSLNGAVTAFLSWDDFDGEAVPLAFEHAFRAHLVEECPALRSISPPVDGYPLTPENLALSDIECQLLSRASVAPDDSLGLWTREFVAVRNYRRLRLSSPAAVAYERRLEQLSGLSSYVGERAKLRVADHLDGESAELLAGNLGTPAGARACAAEPRGLDWYREHRYRTSGAVLCELLDRFHPEWRKEAGTCPDPYEVLWQLTRTDLPKAFEVLPRYDFLAGVEEKASYVEGLKSDAERLFDEIVGGPGEKLVVNTGLLASSSVSYDPENVAPVDDNRVVHRRIIKIEFSGGTRVHMVGRPTAATVGEDEFDIEQLTISAPGDYVVRVGGDTLELTPGVHQFDEPISVAGDGILVEARAGVIMVSDNKVTFILHR
ncbi:MAG: hypothetical protein ABIG03_03475 [Candidatus Eisenbacteria bacterium]